MTAFQALVLDSSPLGLVTQRAGKSQEGDACRLWLETLLAQGVKVYVPKVCDYEVRRELIRAKNFAGITRLDQLKQLARYLPLTTDVMLKAAELWAQARNAGVVTADIHALDGDAIAAAQALSLGLSAAEYVIATSNVKHISQFASADLWTNVYP